MTLRNKVIAILSSLGITAFSFVGLNQACTFDDEVLKVEGEKLCFENQKDYEIFKNHIIQEYQKNKILFLWGENAAELLAVIQHETKKNEGKFTVEKRGNQNLIDALVNGLK